MLTREDKDAIRVIIREELTKVMIDVMEELTAELAKQFKLAGDLAGTVD